MNFSIEILPNERNLFARANRHFELMEKAKKCQFLVPPTVNVRCYHCDMGDGREGTCRLYEGICDTCRYFKDKKRISKAISMLEDLTEAEREEVLKEFL